MTLQSSLADPSANPHQSTSWREPYPLMLAAKLVNPKSVTDRERVGRGVLRVSKAGFPKKALENPDFNAASGS
jgi:hypothetical protein